MTQRGPGKPEIRVVDITAEERWVCSPLPAMLWKGELGTISIGYHIGFYLTVVEGQNWRDPILNLWVVFCCKVIMLI